jgi:hypothetical protein
LDPEIFEAWYDEADNSVELTSVSEVERMRAIGGWLKKPIFLHRIQAEDLEVAVEIHQDMMDWDNFWAQKDLVQLCHGCGARYFLRRSVFCPNCDYDPEAKHP